MSWIQVTIALPTLALVVALVHDFLAGLGEERLWSDPALDDPQSLAFRAAAAELTHNSKTDVREPSAGADRWDLLVPVPQS